MRTLFCAIAVGFLSSGCQTIYFEKGNSNAITIDSHRWHHGGGILGLVEFSDPYNPAAVCKEKGWESVKVDQSFVTGLVSGLVPYGIYTPWLVGTRCSH